MNVLDRVVSVFSPQRGLARATARLAINSLNGGYGYDGAHVGRRTGGWIGSNASANAIIRGPLPALRARSRDLVRNTWWGNRIKSTWLTHTVGHGIRPKFDTGNKSLDKRAADLWAEWGENCDAEGQLDINGIIALALGCTIESGEALLRRRYVKARPGLRVPLELQLLEPDHLDLGRDGLVGGNNFDPQSLYGLEVADQGVIYDPWGKRIGYWLWPHHPGDITTALQTQSIRVDAADIAHIYRKDRIGQGRGVPWLTPIILKGKDVSDLEEAIVVKSRIEACFAMFVKSNDQARTIVAGRTDLSDNGRRERRIEGMRPGMVVYGEPGEEASAVTPSSSLAFESVLMSSLLALAAGAGITYDQMTGDLRQANYSSLRAGKVEFRGGVTQFQHLTMSPMLLNRIGNWFIDAAQDAGELPRRKAGGAPIIYRKSWIMPAWEPIDPLKDLQADILAVRSGRTTWAEFVSAWGFDPDTQLDQIATWMETLDKKKVILDSDPRRALANVKGAAKQEAEGEFAAPVETGEGDAEPAKKGKAK